MSTIKQLSIRGIRNFGVDAEDEQKIIFSAPLTLILGQNGSGKTTIIECIKYALTGDMPPNTDKGVAFINSPHVLHTTESLGKVELHMKDISGADKTIGRSAKVTIKNQKLTFETQHAVTGDMCAAMGVSKAIINRVLFSPQEESNWPLGTDKEVKEIFDEIFGTSKYNDALTKIREMRKAYEKSVAEKRSALKDLKMIKEHVDKRNMEIDNHEIEINRIREKINECDVKLKPLREEHAKFVKIGEELSSLTTRKAKVETDLKNKAENCRKLADKIRHPFNGTEDELNYEMQQFTTRRDEKKIELDNKENILLNAISEYSDLEQKYIETDREYHSLRSDRQREQNLCAEKAKYIENMCTKLNITMPFDLINCIERADELVPHIKTEMTKIDDKISDIAAHNDCADDKFEEEFRQYSAERSHVEGEIMQIAACLKKAKARLVQQSNELRKNEQNASTLKIIQNEIANIRQSHDDLVAKTNAQAVRDVIAEFRAEKQQLSKESDEIVLQITELSTMATLLAQITTKQKHLENKEAEKCRIINKHRDSLQRLMPDENVNVGDKLKIEGLLQELRIKIHHLETEIRRKDNQINVGKSQQLDKDLEIEKFHAKMRHLEDEIERECDSKPFDDYLATINENVDKYQMEYSELKSSGIFYKNYIKKMRDQPCCPLCHTDLSRTQVDDLSSELLYKINSLPENIRCSEQLLHESRAKLDKLLKLQSSVDEVKTIKCDLIPNLKNELKQIETVLAANEEILQKFEANSTELKSKIDLIAPMIGDVSILDVALREIDQARTELETLHLSLPSNHKALENGDLKSLQSRRKEVNDRMKTLENEISDREKKLNDDEGSINGLKEKEIALLHDELQLKCNIQNVEELRAREEELGDEITKLSESAKLKYNQLVPIEEKIRHTVEKRRSAKMEGANSLKAEKMKYENVQKDFNRIDNLAKELEKLASRNLDNEIERTKQLLDEQRGKKITQAAQIKSIREEINALTKEYAGQDSIERDLMDSLDLAKIKKEITEMENELTALNENERYFNFERISEEKLSNKIAQLIHEKTSFNGEIIAKTQMIATIRSEINQPKYCDACKNYKQAYYENVVLTKTIEDLITCCESLEMALFRFHSKKIEKINSVIRNLWRTIYKGNDIDYIQIETKEVKGSKDRRSYTCRVIASKNDQFMDFRGRSSAGQRVLACLIIRIALAELFSGHCGVLALDEPTTNLDQLNIESLCNALNDIVAERGNQNNFMLIVITHDETFISSLRHVQDFYRVSRDINGKSCAEKMCNVESIR